MPNEHGHLHSELTFGSSSSTGFKALPLEVNAKDRATGFEPAYSPRHLWTPDIFYITRAFLRHCRRTETTEVAPARPERRYCMLARWSTLRLSMTVSNIPLSNSLMPTRSSSV